jgi:hypothetical protein
MKTYQATLFHPAGDYVRDFGDSPTIQHVWDRVNDMGSRWIFYPIVFVTTEKTVVDTPDGLEFLKGRRIRTVSRFLKEQWDDRADEIIDLINCGAPMECVY